MPHVNRVSRNRSAPTNVDREISERFSRGKTLVWELRLQGKSSKGR
jgi:hypothetical protein